MGHWLVCFVRWYQRFTSPLGQGWISTCGARVGLIAGVELAGNDDAVV